MSDKYQPTQQDREALDSVTKALTDSLTSTLTPARQEAILTALMLILASDWDEFLKSNGRAKELLASSRPSNLLDKIRKEVEEQ